MVEQHIARAFDRDLEGIQALVMKMGGMVETAILEAAQCPWTAATRNWPNRSVGTTRRLTPLELKINEEAARLIALRAPTASDLRMVLSVMKIASSLERVGDYAKNMAKRTQALNRSLGQQLGIVAGAGASLRQDGQSGDRTSVRCVGRLCRAASGSGTGCSRPRP